MVIIFDSMMDSPNDARVNKVLHLTKTLCINAKVQFVLDYSSKMPRQPMAKAPIKN